MKVLGIGGEKGSGKSFLIMKLLNKYKATEAINLYPHTKGGVWGYLIPAKKLYIIGRYDGKNKVQSIFGGTDRLSMSVSVAFKEFLNKLKGSSSKVIFEGTRLFNFTIKDFLIQNKISHKFIIINVDDKIIKQRLNTRNKILGKTENMKFNTARKTALVNMRNKYPEIKLVSKTATQSIINDFIK